VQQSNGYILAYTAGLTVVCALVLALVSSGLKEKQEENVQLDMKKNILATVMKLEAGANVKDIYSKRVKSYIVDANGDVVKDMKPESQPASFVAEQYKEPVNNRKLPVYEIVSETDPNKSEYFVVPIYGYGLWNNISGYVALEGDLNTIKGVKFAHVGETPGLGARITDEEIQSRYAGKKLFDGQNIVAVLMQKGENGGGEASIAAFKDAPHTVDGMSGATITGKGVNNMLLEYFQACYKNFLLARRQGNQQASIH
jgi:Na+-transporting NADH:ubiquinone oxidoreductase subunit C